MDLLPVITLPAEIWLRVLGFVDVGTAATFSQTCRQALALFRCRAHWRPRLNRLGRINVVFPDLCQAFRLVATQISLVLWTDVRRTYGTLRESHQGSPGIGLFPVLMLGPLGCRERHDRILLLIDRLSRLTPTQQGEWHWSQAATVLQAVQALLVVSHRLGIRLSKIRTLSCDAVDGLKFEAGDSISIERGHCIDFMGASRQTCREISTSMDRMTSSFPNGKATTTPVRS